LVMDSFVFFIISCNKLTNCMTEYAIKSTGIFHGKPIEVSSNVKAITILVAVKAFVEKTREHKIVLNHLTVTDGATNP